MDSKKMATIFLYAGAAIQFILCMGALWDKQIQGKYGSGKTWVWEGFFGINYKRIGLWGDDLNPKIRIPEFHNANRHSNDADDEYDDDDEDNMMFFAWAFVLLALAASFISGVIRMVYACFSTACDSACGAVINIIQIVFQVIILIGCAGSINRTSAIIKDITEMYHRAYVQQHANEDYGGYEVYDDYGNYSDYEAYDDYDNANGTDDFSGDDDDVFTDGAPYAKPAGGFVTIAMVLLSTLAMVGAEVVVMRSKGGNGRTPTRLVTYDDDL